MSLAVNVLFVPGDTFPCARGTKAVVCERTVVDTGRACHTVYVMGQRTQQGKELTRVGFILP